MTGDAEVKMVVERDAGLHPHQVVISIGAAGGMTPVAMRDEAVLIGRRHAARPGTEWPEQCQAACELTELLEPSAPDSDGTVSALFRWGPPGEAVPGGACPCCGEGPVR